MSDNIALGKTCAQSSTYPGDYACGNAVDDNTSTRQDTQYGANEWWKVDLGDSYNIESINMYKGPGFGSFPYRYHIQIADDWDFTSNVVNIITENNNASESTTWDTDDFGSVNTRYLRVITHTSNQYVAMAEFRVYGSLVSSASFIFSNPTPTNLSTVYGVTQQLYLTTTVSGEESNYSYDATFYDAYDNSLIDTASGIQSGQPAGVIMSTPSGIDYQWYVTATSSGGQDTSDTYTFTNRFLYEGYVTEVNNPVVRMVKLYNRATGELIDTTTSSGVGGYYHFEALNNEQHFIVVFDDDLGESYNALILDKLLPVGVE